MKIARIRHDQNVGYAVKEDEYYRLISGNVFESWEPTDQTVPVDEAELLAPVDPPQIVAIGLNYRQHATESGMAMPERPLVFVKTANTVIGPGEPIILPAMAPDEVDYECELVMVIGKRAKNVSSEEAMDYVLGFTCGNDVSARDCQLRQDKQWARGKCFDTFAPLGPWIVPNLDGDNLDIRLTINGQVMQASNTSDMIFNCRELVSYLSRCMTLRPGSIIMTGTPSGVGFAREPQVFLRNGDNVAVEIESIGALTNPVIQETPA